MKQEYEQERRNKEDQQKKEKLVKINKKNNLIASILQCVGTAVLTLGIVWFISSMNIMYLFIVGGASLLLYALSEIIQILHDIRLKVYSDK